MRREKPLAIICVVFAIVFVVIGIMYVTILPKNLPSFMPGHVEKKTAVKKTPKTTVPGATVAPGHTATTHAPNTAKKEAVKKSGAKYYWKRGVLSFFIAAVLLVVAWTISNTRRRYRRHR